MHKALIILAIPWFLSASEAVEPPSNQGVMANEVKAMEKPKRRGFIADPVSKGGIRYEVLRGARARGFEQNGGIIAAIDESTGEEKWTLVVYETQYDPDEEKDVQDVLIKKMNLSWWGSKLIVTNEREEVYDVDLKTQQVSKR
ncbi:hypothetical protein [Thiohalocapsa sp. ML1]|jgi:hypothetical protein|uniref:hypothetical protein n=1 Tax=Thiohalocapsa sp. ML1 TaxID=1431688 RepID=UPI0012E3850C|nr:hypothetical protein [Thiohalocapsa sp. ML1]